MNVGSLKALHPALAALLPPAPCLAARDEVPEAAVKHLRDGAKK